jgi:hypothetical protein
VTALRDALAEALHIPGETNVVDDYLDADRILATPAGQRIAAVVEAAESVAATDSFEGSESISRWRDLHFALDALGGKP